MVIFRNICISVDLCMINTQILRIMTKKNIYIYIYIHIYYSRNTLSCFDTSFKYRFLDKFADFSKGHSLCGDRNLFGQEIHPVHRGRAGQSEPPGNENCLGTIDRDQESDWDWLPRSGMRKSTEARWSGCFTRAERDLLAKTASAEPQVVLNARFARYEEAVISSFMFMEI